MDVPQIIMGLEGVCLHNGLIVVNVCGRDSTSSLESMEYLQLWLSFLSRFQDVLIPAGFVTDTHIIPKGPCRIRKSNNCRTEDCRRSAPLVELNPGFPKLPRANSIP